jgi:peroxiredoxin
MDRRLSRIAIASLLVLFACGGAEEESQVGTMPWTASAADDGDDDDDGGTASCPGTEMTDDFAIAMSDAISVVAEPRALARTDRGIATCTESGVEIVDTGAGMSVGAVDLASECIAIAAAGDVVVAGTKDGTVVAIDASASPTIVGQQQVGAALGVATDGTTAFVATGAGGLQSLALGGGLGTPAVVGAVADARGVALVEGALLVAAGDAGVVQLDAASGTNAGSIATPTPALGVRALGDRAAVLRGVYGWDLVELAPLAVATSYETTGVVLDAALVGDEVVTAEGHALVRHGVSGGAARFEERPGARELVAPWLRTVVADGDALWTGHGPALAPVRVDAPSSVPDVHVDVPTLYLWGEPGETVEGLLVVDNLGDAELVIATPSIDAPLRVAIDSGAEPHDDCPDHHVVPAGGSLLLSVELTPADDALVTGELRLASNDPDEPELVVAVDGNRPGPEIGTAAPDFEMLTIDGARFRLSEQRGRVVLLKLFNFGCKMCAEEFAVIESELVPSYAASEFLAVGVNTTHRTAFAGEVARDSGASFPMTLDLDSEAFRTLRMPEKVFPLNIVLDREGVVRHVDTEQGLEEATAAIQAAM